MHSNLLHCSPVGISSSCLRFQPQAHFPSLHTPFKQLSMTLPAVVHPDFRLEKTENVLVIPYISFSPYLFRLRYLPLERRSATAVPSNLTNPPLPSHMPLTFSSSLTHPLSEVLIAHPYPSPHPYSPPSFPRAVLIFSIYHEPPIISGFSRVSFYYVPFVTWYFCEICLFSGLKFDGSDLFV